MPLVPNGVSRCRDRAVRVAGSHRYCLDGFRASNGNRSGSEATVTAIVVGKGRRTGRRSGPVGFVVDRIAIAIGTIGRIAEVHHLAPKVGSRRQTG
jgi:hypothetical protein